jgi:uncharacterized iron-regulated membrane protein
MSIEPPATAETLGEADVHPAPAQPSGGARSAWAALRPLVLRLHFYAGVLIAPFLLVAATTGLLYAGSYQAEKILYAHELRVPVGEGTLPLPEQVTAARKAHPEGTVSAVRPSPEAGATTRVLLSGVPGIDETHTLAVFVDPYTGTVRGALEQYGSTGALPLRTWIDEFHRDLHLGENGRLYSELAASWLWVVAGGGLVLWFTRRRAHRKLRATLLPDRTASGRRRTMSFHATVGVWAALGLFFLSATGLTWSAYAGENVASLRESLGQTTPALSSAVSDDHAAHSDGEDHAGMDMGDSTEVVGVEAVLKAARAQGLSDPVEIVPPGDGTAYVVKQIQRSWPEKQDSVAVDPTSGEVTDVVRFADYPVLAKLTRWGIDAHTGVLFGPANQLVLAALTLGVILMILWGYRMWWQHGRDSAFGRPIPRSTWRQVPLPVLLPLAIAVAAVGWFLPLLGISLAAFLAVDITLGAVARTRAERPFAPTA